MIKENIFRHICINQYVCKEADREVWTVDRAATKISYDVGVSHIMGCRDSPQTLISGHAILDDVILKYVILNDVILGDAISTTAIFG